jgi:hypothetical protein
LAKNHETGVDLASRKPHHVIIYQAIMKLVPHALPNYGNSIASVQV